MPTLNRRSFLTHAALAAAAVPLARSRTALAIDPIGRTRPSHLKLSIAAYSYRQFLTGDQPRMDLFDFANLAADMGLDGIEPTAYYFPDDVEPEYLHRLRRHAFLLGLDISGTAIGNNYCLPPGPEREQQFAMTREWIDRAVALQAPVIRIFAGNVPRDSNEEEAVEWAIEGFHEVLPYAEERGIFLALENHGGITATAEQMLRLVKAVDSPYFGVNLDTGNFRTEDPYGDLALIAPYAVTVQIKTEIPIAGKKEEADLSKLIGILRDTRYSGYVVLEYEADEDPFKAIPRHVETLKELIS